MPFVPTGRKAGRQRRRDAYHAARAAALDRGIRAARMATNSPGLCLPMCVLLGRILDEGFPAHGFSLRLGALHVVAKDEERFGRISFDPRGPGGIDDGFHAWLEDADGFLVDPSILVTLRSHGFEVNPDDYLVAKQRRFPDSELFFVYEELPELELLGLEASEPGLANFMALAMHGRRPAGVVDILLDVGWRRATHAPRG
jgi:hypothetical protein